MKVFGLLLVAVVAIEAVKMIVIGILILAAIQLVAYAMKQRTDLQLDAQRRARYGIDP